MTIPDAAKAISEAFALIQEEDAEEKIRARYTAAKAVVATIPSGTADADLTAEQAAALDEYERCILALRKLDES